MKNEDRIVELLAESLRKQDRHEEILKQLVDGQLALLDSHKKLETGQRDLINEFHKMNDHLLTRQEKMEDRISRLEDKVFKS